MLWIIHIIKNDKWQSQEHTNVQIKVNIPFLYFAASNNQCRRLIVNHRVRFFSDIVNTNFLKNFSDIFLISPTSDSSDFLLNRAVRAAIYVDTWQGPVSVIHNLVLRMKIQTENFFGSIISTRLCDSLWMNFSGFSTVIECDYCWVFIRSERKNCIKYTRWTFDYRS